MDDYIYQTHVTENGAHILVYKFDVDRNDYFFERKIFVPVSEFRK